MSHKFLPNRSRVRVVGPRWPLMQGEIATIIDHGSGDAGVFYTVKFDRSPFHTEIISALDVEPVSNPGNRPSRR